MLTSLLVFLVGCLILAVVLYVCNLILSLITLPDQIKQIALIILGLIGLVVLLMLAINVFRGGVVPTGSPWW